MSLSRFKVVGPRAIDGVPPGGTVSLDTDRFHIPGLIEAGHILPVKSARTPKEKEVRPDPVTPEGDADQ